MYAHTECRMPGDTAVRMGTTYIVFMDNDEILRFLSMAWEIAKKKKKTGTEKTSYLHLIESLWLLCTEEAGGPHSSKKRKRPIMRP